MFSTPHRRSLSPAIRLGQDLRNAPVQPERPGATTSMRFIPCASSRLLSLPGLLGRDFLDLRLLALHRPFLCRFLHLFLGRLSCGLARLRLLWPDGLLIRVLCGGCRPVVIRKVKEHLAAPALEAVAPEIALGPAIVLAEEDLLGLRSLLALHRNLVGDVAKKEKGEKAGQISHVVCGEQ